MSYRVLSCAQQGSWAGSEVHEVKKNNIFFIKVDLVQSKGGKFTNFNVYIIELVWSLAFVGINWLLTQGNLAKSFALQLIANTIKTQNYWK